MTSRPSQYGPEGAPRGGSLSKPITGMGKLPPGSWPVVVLSATRTATNRWSVILQTRRGRECHAEWLEAWPVEYTPGTELLATVEPTEGFVLYRSPNGFQGRDSKSQAPLTGWLDSAVAVYTALTPERQPASSQLTQVEGASGKFTCTPVAHPGVHASPDGGSPAPAGGSTPRRRV